MKKLLLIALLFMGINALAFAQTDTAIIVTIEDVAVKVDNLADAQTSLESRINNIQPSYSTFDNIVEEFVPIIVLAIIGVFLIALTYILSTTSYRKNQLKYDTMLKCAEKTGSVPDFFNKVERHRASVVPVGGRVHLVLSIFCGIIATIFMIVTIASNMSTPATALCGGVGLGFAAACVVLFIQYNRICEKSLNEQ